MNGVSAPLQSGGGPTWVLQSIAGIDADILRSVATLRRREAKLLKAGKISPGDLLQPKQLRQITVAQAMLVNALRRVAKEPPRKKQLRMGKVVILKSFPAKLCSLLRAASMMDKHLPAAHLFSAASSLDPYAGLHEPVLVWWKQKSPTSFRMICSGGLMRRAQQILFRDYLTACGLDSPIDFTRSGSGGERAFVGNVRQKMLGGYDFWITPDIVKAFSSMKLAHFSKLGLDRRLIRNVAFIPKCAKVKVSLPKIGDAKAILEERGLLTPQSEADPLSYTIMLSEQLVRQVLSEGSPVSPLLARSFIGQEVQAALLGLEAIVASTYMDDLAIGARTPNDGQKAIDAVKCRFEKNPAGPIHLKNVEVRKVNRVTVLGYWTRREKRKGKPFIHAWPGDKRIARHKKRLTNVLIAASAINKDLHDAGDNYWRSWYASQVAWTKVQRHSRMLSWMISWSYVDDFLLGIPMGGNAPIIGHHEPPVK